MKPKGFVIERCKQYYSMLCQKNLCAILSYVVFFPLCEAIALKCWKSYECYDDDVSTFDQLLVMDKSFYIHDQNIPRLLIEIYKAFHDVSESKKESTRSFRSKPELVIPSVNFVLKGKNSLRYFGSVIWNSLPIQIREDHLILLFATKIKQ